MNGETMILVILAVVVLAFVSLMLAYNKNTRMRELINQSASTLREIRTIVEKNQDRLEDSQSHLDHYSPYQKSPPYTEPVRDLKKRIDSIKYSHQGTESRLRQLQLDQGKVPQPRTVSSAIFRSFHFHNKWKEFINACVTCKTDAENVSNSILEADKLITQIRNLPVVWSRNISEIRKKNAEIERKIQSLELGGCHGQELIKAKQDCLAFKEILLSVPLAAFQGSADLLEKDVIEICRVHTDLNSRLLNLEKLVNGWYEKHQGMRKAIELMNQAADKAFAALERMPADLDLHEEWERYKQFREVTQGISKRGERIEVTLTSQLTKSAEEIRQQIAAFITRLETISEANASLNKKLQIVKTIIAEINKTLEKEATSLQHPIEWDTSKVHLQIATRSLEGVTAHTKRTPDLVTTDNKSLASLELQLKTLKGEVEKRCGSARKLRENYQTLRNERSNRPISWYEDSKSLDQKTREYHASNWKGFDPEPHSLLAEAEQLLSSLQDKENLPDDFHKPVPENRIDSQLSMTEQLLSSIEKLKARTAKIAEQYTKTDDAQKRSTRRIQEKLELSEELDLSPEKLAQMPRLVGEALQKVYDTKMEGKKLRNALNNKKSLETIFVKEDRLKAWLSVLDHDLADAHAQLETSQSGYRNQISELIEDMDKIVTLSSSDEIITEAREAAKRVYTAEAPAVAKDKERNTADLVKLLQNDIRKQGILLGHLKKTSDLHHNLKAEYQKMEDSYKAVQKLHNELLSNYNERSWRTPVSIKLTPMKTTWAQLQAERESCKQTPLQVEKATSRITSLTISLTKLEEICNDLKKQAGREVNEMQRAWTIAENLIATWKRRLAGRDPNRELKAEWKEIEEKERKMKELPAHYRDSRKNFHQIEAELAAIALDLARYAVQINNQTINVGDIISSSDIKFLQDIRVKSEKEI